MLEQRDLDTIKSIMESVVGKLEESILRQVDEKLEKRLAEQEESILKKVDEKLEKRFVKQEESILRKVDVKILKSEGLLLDEIERTRNILEKQIGKVQQNIDELYKYYRITKLENDNITLIIKHLEDLTKRVEELERRTA